MAKLSEDGEQRSKELSGLRNRTNLSQQNWTQERQDLVSREAFAKEEFEAAKQAMQDWEILAMEERSYRENLTGRVSELEEQLSNQQEAYEKAASERDSQSLTVDGLQRALQDIQDGSYSKRLHSMELQPLTSTKLANKNSANWWRAIRRRWRPCARRWRRYRNRPKHLSLRWTRRRRSSTEHNHLKKRSRRRIS